MTREKRDMNVNLFCKIIDDCIDKPLRKINLFWFGESLLYPGLIKALNYAQNKLPQVKKYLSTNGSLLHKKLAERILETNAVDVLNIDIDGFRKETAEKVRRNLCFDGIVQNVHDLVNMRKTMGKRKPEIRVTIIEMNETVREIEDFKNYWRKLVDHVQVNVYNTWLGSVKDRNVKSLTQKNLLGEFDFPCEHPWNELSIANTGMVSLCCLDYDCKAVVGDVNQQAVEEIWRGERIISFRDLLINGNYHGVSICKNCNAYIFQQNSLWRSLWV